MSLKTRMSLETMTNHQKCFTIILALALMVRGTCGGRKELDAYMAQDELPQLFMEEIWAAGNDDSFYNELKKYHQDQPNYNFDSKWPGLRDLLETVDYDDLLSGNDENANEHFMKRLRKVATSGVNLEELTGQRKDSDNRKGVIENGVELPKLLEKLSVGKMPDAKGSLKDSAHKKNVQYPQFYMSPCHFKICNMGRKRNARSDIYI